MIICTTAMNDWNCVMRAETTSRRRRRARRRQQHARPTSSSHQHGVVGDVDGPAREQRALAGGDARAAEALADTMEPRRTGATSISRRKPNSRSKTIEPAENESGDQHGEQRARPGT